MWIERFNLFATVATLGGLAILRREILQRRRNHAFQIHDGPGHDAGAGSWHHSAVPPGNVLRCAVQCVEAPYSENAKMWWRPSALRFRKLHDRLLLSSDHSVHPQGLTIINQSGGSRCDCADDFGRIFVPIAWSNPPRLAQSRWREATLAAAKPVAAGRIGARRRIGYSSPPSRLERQVGPAAVSVQDPTLRARG